MVSARLSPLGFARRALTRCLRPAQVTAANAQKRRNNAAKTNDNNVNRRGMVPDNRAEVCTAALITFCGVMRAHSES